MTIVTKSIKFGDDLELEDGTRITIEKKTRRLQLEGGRVIIVVKRDGDIGKLTIYHKNKEEADGNK